MFVVVSSVLGTNTIEGGTLTEDETATALTIDPALVKEVEQRRAVNIKAAYDLSQKMAAKPDWSLNIDFILDLHRLITQDIPHPDNRPGLVRNNPKGRVTYVGDEAHGGRYKPPQYNKDIWRLLEALIEWHQDLIAAQMPVLVRAPLVHLYYEQIHPFWDGNGRVGRVIEATLLQAGGSRSSRPVCTGGGKQASMRGLFRRRKPDTSAGPRKNEWKGLRMREGSCREAEVKRARTVAKWTALMLWSGVITGAALIGWVIVMGVEYSGPFLRQWLEINKVTVDGVRRIDKQEVVRLINLKPGTPLHHVVTSAIKERVESHPWVKEATVARVPFHELHISVIERTPAAVIRVGSESLLSDEGGHVLGRLAQSDDDSLPMVTGVDLKRLLRGDEEVRQAVASGIGSKPQAPLIPKLRG